MNKKNILPLVLALATASSLSAKEAAPVIEPAAKTILEESVKALGGREACLKIKSRELEGTMAMAAQGLEMKIKISQKSRTKVLTKIEGPGIVVEHGYDGKTAWSKNSLQGTRKLEGPERDQILNTLAISPELHTLDNLISAKVLEDLVEGEKTFKVVKVTAKNTKSTTLYFDSKTKLLARMLTTTATGPDGEMVGTTLIGGYKEFNGVKSATTNTMKVMGHSVTVTFTSITNNVEIDDSIFALPE